MSGTGFPFDPARVAALSRLADSINGSHAPPPIAGGVEIVEGRVAVPVPDHAPAVAVDARLTDARTEQRVISVELYAGLTLQWSPLPAQGGLMLSLWGGSPDGDQDKDGLACFLTARGLEMLIKDLTAIAVAVEAAIDAEAEGASA